MELRPETKHEGLKQILDRILDKGVVIAANIRSFLGGQELIGIKGITILSSFKTGQQIGLKFPRGTNHNAPAWRNLEIKEDCPQCSKLIFKEDFREHGCPWCGLNSKEMI